eukprot:2428834-Prymnesium_polylepis.1
MPSLRRRGRTPGLSRRRPTRAVARRRRTRTRLIGWPGSASLCERCARSDVDASWMRASCVVGVAGIAVRAVLAACGALGTGSHGGES